MSDERIIAAITVTSGEKDDGPNYPNLLNRAEITVWKLKQSLETLLIPERKTFGSLKKRKEVSNRQQNGILQ